MTTEHQRHRQTDRQTDGRTDGRTRTTCSGNTAHCAASHGKNCVFTARYCYTNVVCPSVWNAEVPQIGVTIYGLLGHVPSPSTVLPTVIFLVTSEPHKLRYLTLCGCRARKNTGL